MGGHTVIEFHSNEVVHKMGTFCLQIPGQITSLPTGQPFEIPDDFMCKELRLSLDENPVQWYNENDKIAWKIEDQSEQAKAVNELFGKFMDAVAKFCNYDRRGAMEERQRWADQFSM